MPDTLLAALGRLIDRLSSLTVEAWSTLRSGMFGSYRRSSTTCGDQDPNATRNILVTRAHGRDRNA
jgi:hypothetical protein